MVEIEFEYKNFYVIASGKPDGSDLQVRCFLGDYEIDCPSKVLLQAEERLVSHVLAPEDGCTLAKAQAESQL